LTLGNTRARKSADVLAADRARAPQWRAGFMAFYRSALFGSVATEDHDQALVPSARLTEIGVWYQES
jgi:hypothetical protein